MVLFRLRANLINANQVYAMELAYKVKYILTTLSLDMNRNLLKTYALVVWYGDGGLQKTNLH